MFRIAACLLPLIFAALPCPATKAELPEAYHTRWDSPALQRRIDANIEKHRKADATIEVVDGKGQPIADATVQVDQQKHAFLFGCNAFVLGQLDTPDMNERYEKAFTKLFNFATVPFYWRGTEPNEGELRYGEGSRRVWRRPPTDRFRAFGEKYGVTLKGHPLMWHSHNPNWLPKDAEELKTLYQKRFREIAPRYSDHIKIWDVVNESLVCNKSFPLYSEDRSYVDWAFGEAATLFPTDNSLMINDVTEFNFRGTKENPYFKQVSTLLGKGLRIEGIGFQMHFFSRPALDRAVGGEQAADPQQLLDTYQYFAKLGLPLWITEITIPSSGNNGPEIQARVTRDLYRLWFSAPKMAGITWWNLGDSLAVKGENRALGGLLDDNLEPKPAYKTLDRLINQDWKTRLNGKTDEKGNFRFRGFHGNYGVRVVLPNGTEKTFTLEIGNSKAAKKRFVCE